MRPLTASFLLCMVVALFATTPLSGASHPWPVSMDESGDEWPDIPLLSIETVDGETPTCVVVKAPEGCIGTSITDNDYVPGRMVMTLGGDTLYDSGEYVKGESGMRIKRRGNSTGAAENHQYPYKLKLSKKADLLMRDGKDFRHKEWVLLSIYVWNPNFTYSQSNLLNATGLIVSKVVGKEWTQQWQFVNVLLNGMYQGVYTLVEPVSKGKQRVDVDSTGFVIEHDTFWWNEGDYYFKTRRQPYQYGYTYKYPDEEDVTDSIQGAIQSYMNDFEDALYDGDVTEYIDMNSFAKWILAHDILCSNDMAGCNRFLYKRDLIPGDSLSTRLCMGPLWDFDSSFRGKINEWSNLHTMADFYFPELFKQEDFVKAYVSQWMKIRPTLLDEIQRGMDEVNERYATSFDESMKMHVRLGYKYVVHKPLKSQIIEVMGKFYNRLKAMDKLMQEFSYYQDGIRDVTNGSTVKVLYDLNGCRLNGDGRRSSIVIVRNADGSTRKVVW